MKNIDTFLNLKKKSLLKFRNKYEKSFIYFLSSIKKNYILMSTKVSNNATFSLTFFIIYPPLLFSSHGFFRHFIFITYFHLFTYSNKLFTYSLKISIYFSSSCLPLIDFHLKTFRIMFSLQRIFDRLDSTIGTSIHNVEYKY